MAYSPIEGKGEDMVIRILRCIVPKFISRHRAGGNACGCSPKRVGQDWRG